MSGTRTRLGLAPPPPAPGPARLRYHEERVMVAAHPVAYPLLRRMREPIRRVTGLGVLVADTALIREVLLDSARCSKAGRGTSADIWTPVLGPRVLLAMHGPDHRELRRRLGPLFSPRAVGELVEPALAPILAEATARLDRGAELDLVTLTRFGASTLIAGIAGLDLAVADDALMRRITALTGLVSLARPRLPPRKVERARAALAPILDATRLAYRAGDAAKLPGRLRELGLEEEEAIGAVAAFVITGTETLVAHIPRFIAMLVDGGLWPRFAALEGEARARAIDEGLRVTTPTPVMLRSATAPFCLGGLPVRAGDRLVLATFLANRQPGELALDGRGAERQRQLWFGAGEHFCIGAPLALAQIEAVTGALAAWSRERGADLEISSRQASRRVLVPGYGRLIVRAGTSGRRDEARRPR